MPHLGVQWPNSRSIGIGEIGVGQRTAGGGAMKYALLTGECLITLSGCGVVQQAQMNNAKKKLATEAMQCSQMVLAVERADCNTAAENSTVRSHANDGDLLDMLLDFAPDEAQRKKILVDNPSALFDIE